MTNALTPDQITANIKKGAFKPHIYLTNLCLSFFQESKNFVSSKMLENREHRNKLLL